MSANRTRQGCTRALKVYVPKQVKRMKEERLNPSKVLLQVSISEGIVQGCAGNFHNK
jgi:hypothetical protein